MALDLLGELAVFDQCEPAMRGHIWLLLYNLCPKSFAKLPKIWGAVKGTSIAKLSIRYTIAIIIIIDHVVMCSGVYTYTQAAEKLRPIPNHMNS